MTKRMSGFRFAIGLIGFLSGITFFACGGKGPENTPPESSRQNVPTQTLYSDYFLHVVRVDVGDNTICYVVTGSQKGGISCLKQ